MNKKNVLSSYTVYARIIDSPRFYYTVYIRKTWLKDILNRPSQNYQAGILLPTNLFLSSIQQNQNLTLLLS